MNTKMLMDIIQSMADQYPQFPIIIPITRITLLPEKSITMKMVPYLGLKGFRFSFAMSNAQKGYVDGVYNFYTFF